MCSAEALAAIRRSADTAGGEVALAVLVLPGALNPVHSEHISSLEIARAHLEQQGIVVIAGFLQPSSEWYVGSKVGEAWAMTFANRIACCDLAGEANAVDNQSRRWIYPWCSGATNGFSVPFQVEGYLNKLLLPERPLHAYMVCGADLVERCGGWDSPGPSPVVVVARPGVNLPDSQPGSGWQLANGETKAVSSTSVREAMAKRDLTQMVKEGCDDAVVEFMHAAYDDGKLFMSQPFAHDADDDLDKRLAHNRGTLIARRPAHRRLCIVL